jgi:UDP-N-acetylglucosamine diphosphorylase/glucosamine-1-phosphate N-acetyltransferase
MSSHILFEPEYLSPFAPITLLRSLAELRYGIFSNLERAQRIFPAESVEMWVRPILKNEHSEKYPDIPINKDADEDAIFLNAATPAWLYPAALNILKESNQTAVVLNGDIIAARPGSEIQFSADFHQKLGRLPKIECDAENCSKQPQKIWEYLDLIDSAMEFDTNLWNEENNILSKLFAELSTLTDRNIFIHNTAQISKFVHLDASNGPIVIDADCKVGPFSSIVGPVYLGKRSSLKPSTFIRQSVIGRICNLGGEIKGCIIHPYTNKGHDGFLGDSILGSWINLGAGTTTSNMKNNYQKIRVFWDGNNYESDRQFLGSIIGDHTKTAIGTRLNTGTLIGAFCNVFQPDFPSRAIPSFSWGNETHELDKAIHTAELMMKRRSLALSKIQYKLIQDLAADHTPFIQY